MRYRSLYVVNAVKQRGSGEHKHVKVIAGQSAGAHAPTTRATCCAKKKFRSPAPLAFPYPACCLQAACARHSFASCIAFQHLFWKRVDRHLSSFDENLRAVPGPQFHPTNKVKVPDAPSRESHTSRACCVCWKMNLHSIAPASRASLWSP
jgi:hypothetical protein